MKNVIILRYGEIFLKGKNQNYFENLLIKNIKEALSDFEFKFTKIQGRYLIEDFSNLYEIAECLKNVFGLTSISPAMQMGSNVNEIVEYVKSLSLSCKTFKVETKRADKTFPIKSNDFSKMIGEVVLKNNNNIEVDVHKPEKIIEIDIREGNKTFVFDERIECLGGMPTGCAGEGLAMLSGGIDSPVACYLINKRGMHNTYIHFYSYPYTSTQAKDKVVELAKILKKFNGKSEIIFIPFTKVQEEIHKHCDNDFMITIMRRIMFKVASLICVKNGNKAIITGECLGQVASQTIESITSSNQCAGLIPVLRPLIAFDKSETVIVAKKIKTYETSILPFEDCCTVFLPKNPIIKPKLEKVVLQESRLNINQLIEDCINNIEIVKV